MRKVGSPGNDMTTGAICVGLISGALLAASANAQPDPPAELIELYQGPVAIDAVVPGYPASAGMDGDEGWVELNFMVNTEGQPYEIMVADHIGNDIFIYAARQALEQTEFRPARIGGEVVDGSATLIYRFVMEGVRGPRESFSRRYNLLISALGNGSRESADRELGRLESMSAHNNTEYAYLSLARYFYAQRYGTPLEQMEHLKNALGESVARPEYESYLGDNALASRRALVQLQARNRYFGEALETLELMRLRGDQEGIELFRDLAGQLEALRNNEEPYGVAGRIADDGSWDIVLFKGAFYFTDVAGLIDELKLRCQRGYVFFNFDPETQYQVSDGVCSLEVIGDSGTTFTLVQ